MVGKVTVSGYMVGKVADKVSVRDNQLPRVNFLMTALHCQQSKNIS
jgi:hypothetical protein